MILLNKRRILSCVAVQRIGHSNVDTEIDIESTMEVERIVNFKIRPNDGRVRRVRVGRVVN